MKHISSILSRFPEHEFTVHRLFTADPNFRVLCEDHQIASQAFERWKDDPVKTEDYRQLIRELEAQILTVIETADRSPPH